MHYMGSGATIVQVMRAEKKYTRHAAEGLAVQCIFIICWYSVEIVA